MPTLFTHSPNFDNGKEFAYHQTVAERLDAQGYRDSSGSSPEDGLLPKRGGLIFLEDFLISVDGLVNSQRHQLLEKF